MQNAEFQSAKQFFATAHSFPEQRASTVQYISAALLQQRNTFALVWAMKQLWKVLGQAVNQSAEVQSAMEFFATAHSFPEGCQAYKNEVYLLPTDLDEASQRTHREHSPSDVDWKVPVRSCRECHQVTADHQFVDKQLSRVSS